MKAVGVAAAIFGMVGAVAAQTCCDEMFVVEATFKKTATGHFRRLHSGEPLRELQPTAPVADGACTTGRTPLTTKFDAKPTGDPVWMFKEQAPADYTEIHMTRAMIDLATDQSYWTQDDGTGSATTDIPAAKRITVIHVSEVPEFDGGWTGGSGEQCDTKGACVTCADPVLDATNNPVPAKWTAASLAASLATADAGQILILAEDATGTTVLDGWNALIGTGGTDECTTCSITVAASTGDLNADIITALGASLTPASCDICSATPPASPTTTGPPGGGPAPTTAPGGGNPPPTTTTTTTGEASSAARVFAGVVPVATAALLALVL